MANNSQVSAKAYTIQYYNGITDRLTTAIFTTIPTYPKRAHMIWNIDYKQRCAGIIPAVTPRYGLNLSDGYHEKLQAWSDGLPTKLSRVVTVHYTGTSWLLDLSTNHDSEFNINLLNVCLSTVNVSDVWRKLIYIHSQQIVQWTIRGQWHTKADCSYVTLPVDGYETEFCTRIPRRDSCIPIYS